METMLYNLELNIKGLDERLVAAMKRIGGNHGYVVVNHGKDHLVFMSDRFNDFTGMINCLSNVCESYGVDYVSLLDLD